MTRRYVNAGMILVSLVILSLGEDAWGQTQLPLMSLEGGSARSMTRLYDGTSVIVGEFPGKLVRLNCESNWTSIPATRCGQTNYALIVGGGEMVHALLPGTEEAQQDLDSIELPETDVMVYGKYYPSTGVILVNRVVGAE